MYRLILLLGHFLLVGSVEFSATVAQDGSGDYTTIPAAIAAAPANSNRRYYIRIKEGVYKGHVFVPKNKPLLSLVGDNAATTIIVDNRSNATGYNLPFTATMHVQGEGFTAQTLTIENSSGVKGNQAIALLTEGHKAAFYKCVIKGVQDTLYALSNMQFYKECDIYGSMDFICGAAQAVFQDCRIRVIPNNGVVFITAQSKEKPGPGGFSFDNCRVTLAPGTSQQDTRVYLGRPWRRYSTVVYMNTFLDSIIDSAGWHNWRETIPVDKVYYGEYNNRGPGANTRHRVNWSSYHIITSASEASMFNVENFIKGNHWLPETKIPFRARL